MFVWPAALALAFAALGRRRRRGTGAATDGSSTGAGPSVGHGSTWYPDPPPRREGGIPMAEGVGDPLWPVLSTESRGARVSYKDVNGRRHGNSSRRFGASRMDGERYHAGVDLYAEAGDIVVAPEPGEISAIRPFYHGSYAIYLCTFSGYTINLGEVEKNSWKEFGVEAGSRLNAGQPIARVALMSGGSHMLHFEMYQGCRKSNQRWWPDKATPSQLRNPTDYLLRAAQRFEGATPTHETPTPDDHSQEHFPADDRTAAANDIAIAFAMAGYSPAEAADEAYAQIYPECPTQVDAGNPSHQACMSEWRRLRDLAASV